MAAAVAALAGMRCDHISCDRSKSGSRSAISRRSGPGRRIIRCSSGLRPGARECSTAGVPFVASAKDTGVVALAGEQKTYGDIIATMHMYRANTIVSNTPVRLRQ
jgi:hypothetical protein